MLKMNTQFGEMTIDDNNKTTVTTDAFKKEIEENLDKETTNKPELSIQD